MQGQKLRDHRTNRPRVIKIFGRFAFYKIVRSNNNVSSGLLEISIQRIERWESIGFLECRREGIESFIYAVSNKMLYFDEFHHLYSEIGTAIFL